MAAMARPTAGRAKRFVRRSSTTRISSISHGHTR